MKRRERNTLFLFSLALIVSVVVVVALRLVKSEAVVLRVAS